MDVLIDTHTAINLSFVKWIKFGYILFICFYIINIIDNKSDYTCYQIKYDIKYYLNYAFVMDMQWSFAKLSRMNALIVYCPLDDNLLIEA